jgi:hypothetical protein
VAAAASATVSSELERSCQGAWVVRDADYTGSVQAWEVRGRTVTVYDPATRSKVVQTFALESPCRLVRTQHAGGGETIRTTNTFAFAADGLHVGSGQSPGGLRQGSVFTACIGDRVYTFDTQNRGCLRVDAAMRGAPTPAEECVVESAPPAFILRRLDGPNDVQLGISGDGLLSPALAGQRAEREPSLQAAMRRADALYTP